MKKTNAFLTTVLSLLLFSCPLHVLADETGEENRCLAPYFLIQDADPSVDQFPLKDTHVSTTINGVFAETYVTQTYTNEGSRPFNASYIFPASTSAAVHGMKMEIGDEVITAVVHEKEEAKETFEEAKSEGKSASLLEEQRPNVFSMNVANVMPGDTLRIELHYTEMISPTDGTYEFVFPTVVGPRYPSTVQEDEDGTSPRSGGTDSQEWIAAPYLMEGSLPKGTYSIDVKLAAGVPITSLVSKSHDIHIDWTGDSEAQITLANPADYAGNRDFILDYQLTGDDISSGLLLNTGKNENFFMLMLQPPKRTAPEQVLPREYLFLLDISGSMYGFPLDTAKLLITDLVSGLKESDRFNLILFADGDPLLLAPESVSATEYNIRRAIELIDQQEGGGGTELADALKKALSTEIYPGMTRSIITITDGYLSGESEIFNLVRDHMDEADFFSFGIGSSVNRYLIEGMAKTGLGEAFIVTEPEEAAETAERFRTYIESPILTNIQLSFDGFDVYDMEPAAVPTLFAQRPIIVYGKWRGDPAGTVTITGSTSARLFTKQTDFYQQIPVSEISVQEDNEALRYLWARKRVEQLTDFGLSNMNNAAADAVRNEVTAIGINYHLLTPYTSFVAVTETVRNTQGDAEDVRQPQPLPKHVSNFAIGASGYTVGSEPGMLLLIAAAAIALAGVFCRRKHRSAAR